MDITPMIDIVFLLLIFFMVCSTMETQNPVNLPAGYFGDAINHKNATIITLDGEGDNMTVYIGDGMNSDPVPGNGEERDDEITAIVETAYREGKDLVIIKAAGDLYRGEVARIESAIGRVEGVSIRKAVREEK